MMSRIERVKKGRKKYNLIMGIIFLLFLVAFLVGVFSLNVLIPKDLTVENAEDSAYRNVKIIQGDDEWYIKNKKIFLMHTLTEENMVILISSKEKKEISKLKFASKSNVIKVTGALNKLPEDVRVKLSNSYKSIGIKTYDYMLEVESTFDRLLPVFMVLFVLALLIYAIVISNKRFSKLIGFFEDNPRYDYINSEIKIGKSIEVIDNYLINLLGGTFVDLSKYGNYTVKKYRKYGIYTTHIILESSSSSGNKEKTILPRMNDKEINQLKSYLKSIGKNI